MATTTNYGWTTPDDTALVKDGASAIRSLGSSIDTTTKNLNPETATGDISYRSSTANVKTRLPIGTAGQVLTVNSGATAPEWTTISSGGWTTIASGSLPVGSALAITSIPTTYQQLVFIIRNAVTSGLNSIPIRFNNNSTSGAYLFGRNEGVAGTTAMTNEIVQSTLVSFANYGTDDIANNLAMRLTIDNYASSTSDKLYNGQIIYSTNTTDYRTEFIFGGFKSSTAITQLNVPRTDFTGGTYILYGVK